MDNKIITPRLVLGKSVKVKVYSSVHSPVSSLVFNSAYTPVWESVSGSLFNPVESSVIDSAYTPVWESVSISLFNPVESSVIDSTNISI